MTRWLGLLLVVLSLSGPALAEVPPDRLSLLKRGANISSLFEQGSDLALTLDQIKRDGFTHTRVFVLQEKLTDRLYMERVVRLVAESAQRGLGIIVCMTSREKWSSASPPSWNATWHALAQQLKPYSARFVFPELDNEPSLNNWDTIQDQLLQTVRTVLPQNTIILTGSPLSEVWALPDEPSPDRNVIYSFHEYQPMDVTHQGAEWDKRFQAFVGLDYPPQDANITRLTNPTTRASLDEYRRTGAILLQREIDQAAAWAAAKHIPVICDEFGVYDKASLATRTAWLSEARKRLEEANIGWTVWEYQGGFGVAPLLPNGSLTRALGLAAK
jgi:hypothetical protein